MSPSESSQVVGDPARRRRVRLAAAFLATAAVVVPIGWMWVASFAPASFSVAQMGTPDYGGGPAPAHRHGPGALVATGLDVRTIVEPDTGRAPDVALTLTARAGQVRPGPGPAVPAYTLNGTTPGPTVTAREGDLVQVTFVNESVPGGATLHWHGLDVPNAEDGVAGVTQDAVRPGQSHTYRFVARQVGTYWYHSHQVSHEQVVKGLLGAVVVLPRGGIAEDADVLALTHLYAGRRTVAGRVGDVPAVVRPGATARVRVVNTDNGVVPVWMSGAAYRVIAVDGTEVHGPTPVRDRSVVVPAGGRVDLAVPLPADGSAVRVELGGSAVVLGPAGSTGSRTPAPGQTLDLLSYGEPAPLGFDPASADRRFEYRIGRRPGFVRGRPGVWWTVNGHLYPAVPMFMVSRGDVVTMHIDNSSGQAHPMHLHGHHVVVLARDGVRATGSPWWTDSLEVRSGQSYDVAFVADNPGIWMDHCHNLPHAQQGLVAHVMYEGVTTGVRTGRDTVNSPE